ncbi:protein phosphatase 1 regulatory subunit 3C-B-like [Denticeps clupeoides]|uniref:CBM21 domain-containing protein n=1 Tax=Denticeps clupeoides TaxID=299321 RepID=A0AAY4D2W1_9TELE|nr:protein phosphatase 1 regulatory subunit 3C-like [Denticeps clupeoides]
MTCANVLPMFFELPVSPTMVPVEDPFHLNLVPPESRSLCHFQSISPSERFGPVSIAVGQTHSWRSSCGNRKKRRVIFADSKGLPLTAVRFFSKKDLDVSESPTCLKMIKVLATESRCTPCRPQLAVDFQQPSANYQAFRSRLQASSVLLESCSITSRSLQGTVRVLNLSFQKAVHVRITFDSWHSHRDVPCHYLHQCYGGFDTDLFEFDILLPEQLCSKERVEFCVSYLASGHQTPLWDNNNGQNYRVIVSDTTASEHPLPSTKAVPNSQG